MTACKVTAVILRGVVSPNTPNPSPYAPVQSAGAEGITRQKRKASVQTLHSPLSNEYGTHGKVKNRLCFWLGGGTRAEDAQGTPTLSHISRSILQYTKKNILIFEVAPCSLCRGAGQVEVDAECGTRKTVKASFQLWLSGESPLILLKCSLFARKRTTEAKDALYSTIKYRYTLNNYFRVLIGNSNYGSSSSLLLSILKLGDAQSL